MSCLNIGDYVKIIYPYSDYYNKFFYIEYIRFDTWYYCYGIRMPFYREHLIKVNRIKNKFGYILKNLENI